VRHRRLRGKSASSQRPRRTADPAPTHSRIGIGEVGQMLAVAALAVRHVGNLTDKQQLAAEFPIRATRSEFDDFSANGRCGRKCTVRESGTRCAACSLSRLRRKLPNTGEWSTTPALEYRIDELARLSKLSNIDKHRRLTLVAWYVDLVYWAGPGPTSWHPAQYPGAALEDSSLLGHQVCEDEGNSTSPPTFDMRLTITDDPGSRQYPPTLADIPGKLGTSENLRRCRRRQGPDDDRPEDSLRLTFRSRQRVAPRASLSCHQASPRPLQLARFGCGESGMARSVIPTVIRDRRNQLQHRNRPIETPPAYCRPAACSVTEPGLLTPGSTSRLAEVSCREPHRHVLDSIDEIGPSLLTWPSSEMPGIHWASACSSTRSSSAARCLPRQNCCPPPNPTWGFGSRPMSNSRLEKAAIVGRSWSVQRDRRNSGGVRAGRLL
jgi:hypothetical protein